MPIEGGVRKNLILVNSKESAEWLCDWILSLVNETDCTTRDWAINMLFVHSNELKKFTGSDERYESSLKQIKEKHDIPCRLHPELPDINKAKKQVDFFRKNRRLI